MSREPRWLLVSSYFPPRFGGGGTVYRNLLRHFDQDVLHVVTQQVPRALREKGPRLRCRMHWVPGWPSWVRGQVYLDLLVVPFVALYCAWVALRNRPRHILATVPEVTFAFAAYLAHVVTRVPFSLYLHDTIVEAQVRSPSRWLARSTQARMLRAATTVFVLSDALADLYRMKYGIETVVIPHCVDDAALDAAKAAGNAGAKTDRAGVPVIGFTGAVYSLNMDSLIRMSRAVEALADARFVVSTPHAVGARRLFGGSRTEFRFFEAREDLRRFQQGCDVLFLPLAFDYRGGRDEVATVFPTKLLDYLVSETPTLVHAPDFCFLTRFAQEEGIALVVDKPDVDALREGVERLLEDRSLRRRVVVESLRVAERYRSAAIAEQLKSYLFARASADARPTGRIEGGSG